MQDTITRNLNAMASERDKAALRPLFNALAADSSSQALVSAGLVIKAGASPLVKTGASAWYGIVAGTLVRIAASTDMAALSGTVTNAKFNVYCYFVDAAGTLSSQMGTEGASLATLKFPDFPATKTLIGFTIINPTGTGNFVGGTTALDDATVVPNAVHLSTVGSFDPTIIL